MSSSRQPQKSHKLKDLEKQLKTFKDKSKEQARVQSQVSAQMSRIRQLESEITKMKSAKISAQRQWKEL